ncbi:hypothetical protein SH2C18_05540 [Clostridium sediminicola]|uniref:preprotein translocase subunit YajC n=1 Tax=Clostridium sediminicola TaxID=3114879 RepID=UPI0031F274BF
MQQLMAYLPMIALLAVFYLVLFLPEKKRRKKYQSMLESLNVNDEILTRGGIVGKIIKLEEEFIILESGPDRARIKVQKNGIASITQSVESQE